MKTIHGLYFLLLFTTATIHGDANENLHFILACNAVQGLSDVIQQDNEDSQAVALLAIMHDALTMYSNVKNQGIPSTIVTTTTQGNDVQSLLAQQVATFKNTVEQYITSLGQVYQQPGTVYGKTIIIASRLKKDMPITPKEYQQLINTLQQGASQLGNTISIQLTINDSTTNASLQDVVSYIKNMPLTSTSYTTYAMYTVLAAATIAGAIAAYNGYQNKDWYDTSVLQTLYTNVESSIKNTGEGLSNLTTQVNTLLQNISENALSYVPGLSMFAMGKTTQNTKMDISNNEKNDAPLALAQPTIEAPTIEPQKIDHVDTTGKFSDEELTTLYDAANEVYGDLPLNASDTILHLDAVRGLPHLVYSGVKNIPRYVNSTKELMQTGKAANVAASQTADIAKNALQDVKDFKNYAGDVSVNHNNMREYNRLQEVAKTAVQNNTEAIRNATQAGINPYIHNAAAATAQAASGLVAAGTIQATGNLINNSNISSGIDFAAQYN